MRGRPSGGAAVTAAAALLLIPLLSLATAAPAHATGYRYWSFWQAGDGGWTYAQQGPAISRPSNGDVEGWRFAVSEDSSTKAARPRATADFTAICGGTPAKDGRKRIALVIDFGTPADAPEGERPPAGEPRTECARVAEDATSADVLAAVADPLRYDSNALLCAIAGYPESECGDTVSSQSRPGPGSDSGAKARASDEAGDRDADSGGPALGLLAGGAAVVVLGAAAVWQARRRRP